MRHASTARSPRPARYSSQPMEGGLAQGSPSMSSAGRVGGAAGPATGGSWRSSARRWPVADRRDVAGAAGGQRRRATVVQRCRRRSSSRPLAPCCNRRCSCSACRHTPRRHLAAELPVSVQLFSVPSVRPAAMTRAELPVSVQLFSVPSDAPPPVVGRVARQRAVVQRAAEAPRRRSQAELPVSVQLFSVLPNAPPPSSSRVAGQRAVVQRAADTPRRHWIEPSCRSVCSCSACRRYAPPPSVQPSCRSACSCSACPSTPRRRISQPSCPR